MTGTHFYDINHESSTVVEPEYNASGDLRSSKFINDHLKRHIIPIVNGRRRRDSSVFDYEFLTLTNTEIQRELKRFSRNYGEFCDGKKLRVYEDTMYFKFTTNIVISIDAGREVLGKQKLFSLIDLYARSKQQLPTLNLFVNGAKVPDSKIKVYMSDTCTDILLPMSYLIKNADDTYKDMEVYIQKRIYQVHHYYTDFYDSIPGKQLSLNLKSSDLMNCKLDFTYKTLNGQITSQIDSCKNIIVYVNGMYKLPSLYYMSIDNNILTIDLTNANVATTDFVELVIDSDVKTVNVTNIAGDYSTDASVVRCYFNLQESNKEYKRNFLFGSLPKENCYFFINGKHIPLNKITQVGRLNYVYESKESPYAPYACSCIYTDRDNIDESKSYIYGDDYYLSNFYGIDRISKILNTIQNGSKPQITDEFVNRYLISDDLNYASIMTKDGKMYNRNYDEYLNNFENIYKDNESITRNLIKEAGSYLIRDLLNLFGKDDIFDEVYKDEKTPNSISYSFKSRVDELPDTTSFYYILNINGVHIQSSKYEVKEGYQYNYINIPTSLLRNGMNRIHIRQNKFDNGKVYILDFKSIYPNDFKELIDVETSDIDYDKLINDINVEIEELNNNESIDSDEKETKLAELNIMLKTYENAKLGTYKYYYKFDSLSSALSKDDYLCLLPVYNVDGLYYSNENKDHGWMIYKDSTFIKNADNSYTLLCKELPNEQYVVYSKRFAFKYSTVVQNDLDKLEDMSISITGNDGLQLPIIPLGSYTVFLNGERLYNGIDYVFRHPGNYNLITYTSLCLKRKTKKGDLIDIYFDNVRNVTVGHSNDILSHSGTAWNKYGLIYFGNLSYPYSPKYIDLYINGKYVYPDQIDILSDKLIRVDPEFENPMFDIFAETTFSVDLDKLKYFFEYGDTKYVDSPLEKIISDRFSEYDFSKLVNPSENTQANIIYEQMDEDVDSWQRMPNVRRAEDSDEALEKAEEIVSKRYDLYENAYLIWLKSNSVKTIINTNKNINEDILNYFKFYLEDTLTIKRHDVVVSIRNTRLFNDLELSAKKYPINHSERVQRYLKFIKGNKLGIKTGREELRKHLPISNAMYPRDFPKVISSKTRISNKNKDLIVGGKPGPIYTTRTTDESTEE